MHTLTPDQWKEVSSYLDEILELVPEERAAWLVSLATKDARLASMVQTLLDEQQQLELEGFLEMSPISKGAGLVGQKVGAYTLVSQIGQGGMGRVWLAQRSDGRFDRQAAVKFVNVAFTGRVTEERFKREGSILGRLTHPHIAELLDAGISSDGTPYLVLEYVNGVAIDRYCDDHKLDVEARAKLFLDVLDAVAEAHANLIVHRDIKTPNVLVRNDGQVKLLDFGIAKLLAPEGDASSPTMLTMEGSGPLTPQFAAPEQVTGGPITTATDIYALGVLLYLLLTGQHPAGADSHSPAQLVKAIVEAEPPRASDMVAAGSAVAEKRSTTFEKLRRQLRGDLDTILGKALKKNPQERYASATAFADDLRRFLRHEAISARPDTFAYRTSTFLRRNRTVVALTTLAIALVIGSLSIGLLIANRERKIAEQRFLQVRQLANKFIALDNDIRGLPGSTKVRMQMVSDSQQYLTSLGNDVHGDKDLALEIAFAYVRVAHALGDPTSPNLGQFADAEASLGKAQNFVDSVLKLDPNNQRGLFIATTIAHDRMELAVSLGAQQEELLRDSAATTPLIEQFMSTHPTGSHDLYSMRYFYGNVAGVDATARSFNDAVRYCQRALDIPLSSTQGNGYIITVLAYSRWQLGDLDGALKTTGEGIKLEEDEAAGGHASMRGNLANGYELQGMILGRADAEPNMGHSREALYDFRKALDIGEDLAQKDASDYLGRQHVATASLEIGNIVRHQNPQDALQIYDHAIARIREARSNVSAQRNEAELLAASSYALRWTGRESEAKQRIARAFELLNQAERFSVDKSDKVEPMGDAYDALRAQADDYAETQQANKAIEAYQKLLDRLMAWKPDPQNDLRDSTCISRTWTALVNLLRRSGHKPEADRLEAQRSDLWNHWSGKLPNAQFLLRQSLNQITPPKASATVGRR
jgi:serine/threonine protein kinase